MSTRNWKRMTVVTRRIVDFNRTLVDKVIDCKLHIIYCQVKEIVVCKQYQRRLLLYDKTSTLKHTHIKSTVGVSLIISTLYFEVQISVYSSHSIVVSFSNGWLWSLCNFSHYLTWYNSFGIHLAELMQSNHPLWAFVCPPKRVRVLPNYASCFQFHSIFIAC